MSETRSSAVVGRYQAGAYCWMLLGDTKLALLLDVVGRWKVVKVTDQARTSPVPGRESKEVKVIPSATALAALNITLSLELSKSYRCQSKVGKWM